MVKFFTTSGDYANLTGEWCFEDHGPTSGPNTLVLPNGTELPSIVNDDGQIFYVRGSGTLVITSGGVWKKVQASNFSLEAPANPVYHFPQSGYYNATALGYPTVDDSLVNQWRATNASSGGAFNLLVGNGNTPVFDIDLGFAAVKFSLVGDGDKMSVNSPGNIVEGNSSVCTLSAAVRYENNPSGYRQAIQTYLNNVGGFSIACEVASSGVLRFAVHNGSSLFNWFGTTVLEEDTNYRFIFTLDSGGNGHIFINGVEDTISSTNGPLTGTIQQSDDFTIGSSQVSTVANGASGLIIDAGLWYRDVEAEGELEQLDRYLEQRFSSLDGS